MQPIDEQGLVIRNDTDTFYEWMYDTIRPYVRGKILEIGSGAGYLTELLLQRGHQLKISDPDKEYWKQLVEKYEHHAQIMGITNITPSNKRFEENYARYLGKCYTVILLNNIQPGAEESDVLANLKKLVAINGNLILRLPVRISLFGHADGEELDFWRHRNRQAIRKLFGTEFELKETWFFNLSNSGSAVNHPLLTSFTSNSENDRNRHGLFAIAVGRKNQ